MITALANPQRFMALSRSLLPWLAGLAVALFAIGLPWSLFIAPPDYQQGDAARIMFVHVPAAWMSMAVYMTMAAAAISFLVWGHVVADVAVKTAAPLGAAFTAIALITGSLWGQPMWGTWWVWDARLTSVLVLFFLYLGAMALRGAMDDETKAGKACAILVLVGVINIPIIKFSVDWWNTLHQPASVFRAGGPAIDPSLLWPLLVMALAFTIAFAAMLVVGMRGEILRRRVIALEMRRARG